MVLRLAIAAGRRYLDDGMIDRAPAISYYGMLSLFPVLLIAFALLRVVGGPDSPAELAEYARENGASSAVGDALRETARTALDAPQAGAGAIGVVGLVTLVYGASRGFTAAGRALDAVARRPSLSRSLTRRTADVAWTIVLLVASVGAVVLMTLSGRVLADVFDLLGVADSALTTWRIARWPLGAVLVGLVVATVRWTAPTGAQLRFRPLTPGAAVTVAAVLLGTVGFDVYVTEIASYNATYGAFAGVIILLLWLWLVSGALLYGAELDAVLAEWRAGERDA
jgi:membrane protein